MPDPRTHTPTGKLRARGLGLRFDGIPGPNNAITDVTGISVGYSTILTGQGPLIKGQGPVRTGVTAILPRPVDQLTHPLFAGLFSLNGNGEMTGSHYIEEAGKLSMPITLTNTHSCGLARDATVQWATDRFDAELSETFSLPVSAETYDGFLNDINGFHVKSQHVFAAIDTAATGPIEEGSVGGGTGMKCFGFKAGSGTASRLVSYAGETFTLGVFVQANFGARADFILLGHRAGQSLAEPAQKSPKKDAAFSSIIVVIATDAPLLPHQLKRLARRATFGIGRLGGYAQHGSGDLFLAFSTASDLIGGEVEAVKHARFIPDEHLDPLFQAVVQSTEEAILNSLIANADMQGRDGNFVPALPHQAVRQMLGL